MIQVVQRFKRKPPNKLKPLGKMKNLKKRKLLNLTFVGGGLPLQQDMSTGRRLSQTIVLSASLKNL